MSLNKFTNDVNLKRKSDAEILSTVNIIDNETRYKNYKRCIMDDDYESLSNSSCSTTPLYSSQYDKDIKLEDQLSISDGFSSDEIISVISNGSKPKIKSEPYLCHSNITPSKTQNISINEDYTKEDDHDTFCVDMSRYNTFTTSSRSGSNLLNVDFLNFDLPLTKVETVSPPIHTFRNRRYRNQIYKPHRHNKNITIPRIPCKGPACTSQICCAQYCSQSCFTNQMQPIGTGGLKSLMTDFDTGVQQEINVTDYGLPYPDHTYCRDHKNVFFSSDLNIDSPPYCDLVEKLFYDEKEARIKNPRPEPNMHGDPISTNGYVSPAVRRGRPKRSNVVGLLDPYLFHPSTDVVYTPFLFKENIVKADRLSNQMHTEVPIEHAIRQCTNLYRHVRPDLPSEVTHTYTDTYTDSRSLHGISDVCGKLAGRGDAVDSLCHSVIDDLFDQAFFLH